MKKMKTSVRRILSFVLSVVMVCAVVNMPSIAKAQSYGSESLTTSMVLMPGDVISIPENTYLTVLYKYIGQDDTSYQQFSETQWSYDSEEDEQITNTDSVNFYDKSFTLPSKPADSDTGTYFYQVESKYVYSYNSEDSTFSNPPVDGEPIATEVKITAVNGFIIQMFDKEGNQLVDGDSNPIDYVVTNNSGTINTTPAIAVDETADNFVNTEVGDLLGFWTVTSYANYDANAVFIQLADINSALSEGYFTKLETLAQSQNGVVKLYPVYEYEKSTLTFEVDSYFENPTVTPTPVIKNLTTNRPEDSRTYTTKYYKKASAEDTDYTTELTEAPNEAGQYKVELKMEAVDGVIEDAAEGNGIKTITKRGYSEVTATYILTVKSNKASIVTAPEAKTLTYNGEDRELVHAGTAAEGAKIVYRVGTTGDFTDAVPKKKDAGNYDVYYKAIPVEGNANITTESEIGGPVNVTINQVTVGIEWSEETDFSYNETEQCPTATATGLIGNDECTVTVEGASAEVGDHTATATGLSNPNYTLPSSGLTKNFKITDRRPVSYTVNPATSLVYNGNNQNLIASASTEVGNIQYSTDGENFYDDIPTGKNAGSYDVWYKVINTGSRPAGDVQKVTVTIAPKTVGLSWSDVDVIWEEGIEHCPTVTISGLVNGDTCTATVTGTASTIGTFTARVTGLSNQNYQLPDNPTISFSILDPNTKPAMIVKAPDAIVLTYDGTSQKLVTAGTARNGYMVYSLTGEANSWSTTIPVGKNAKEYTVYFKAACDGINGRVDSKPDKVLVKIEPKAVSVSWSNAKFTYDKKEHCPDATISGVVNGDSCGLSVSGGQVGAGTYTVKATGVTNSNYKLSDSSSVVMTILPKEIGISWKDTEFFYDGKTHCPVAVATGLCEGDSCGVNVSGAQREIGTYTAKVESITNSNYKLSSDSTVEFQILDPNKLKGDISVSMQGYIYGGTPTTPQIKSKTHDIKTAKIAYKVKGNPDATYKETAPREVGEYIVRVTLPETEEYNAVVATATFSITYLPMPSNAYQLTGTLGNGDWYTSNITITPATGYEISIGDRFHFSSGPVKIDDSVIYCDICVKKTSTGEQTEMVTIGPFQIDSQAPTVVGMSNNGLYYADETGGLKVLIKDPNISKVLLDGKEVELTRSSEGTMYFMITPGNRKQVTSFVALDMAGNKTDFSIIVAPYWLLTGEIVEGDLYLEQGNTYKIPDGVGTTWTLDGDASTYYGGIEFTVGEDGEYSFHKN